MENATPLVVAVAGPAGSGKTSLIQALAGQLQDAAVVHYDRYERVTRQPMDRLLLWMRSGADVNRFDLPELARDLAALKRGESVADPAMGGEIAPGRYIVFETPFGREHRQTAEYIDLLIWIDVPLDIALARKMRQFTGAVLAGGNPGNSRDFTVWVHTYLDHYLRAVHDLQQIQRERVRAKADIIIDGTGNLPSMVRQALAAVRDRTSGRKP